MKNIVIRTKDVSIINSFLEYVQTTYSIVPDIFTGTINWNGHDDISDSISSFIVPDDFNKKMCERAIGTGIQVLDESNNFVTLANVAITIDDYIPGISTFMESKAKEYGYDNLLSACSYTASTVTKFQIESVAFNAWRDSVWETAFTALATFDQNGIFPKPDDFIASLPTYESFLPPTP
jgi:hypothetical protein